MSKNLEGLVAMTAGQIMDLTEGIPAKQKAEREACLAELRVVYQRRRAESWFRWLWSKEPDFWDRLNWEVEHLHICARSDEYPAVWRSRAACFDRQAEILVDVQAAAWLHRIHDYYANKESST